MDYFLELEDEFKKTQKYVAFDKTNKRTYSVEYLKLIQAVCSEIDVVGKEIATYFDPNFANEKKPNIQKWGYTLHKHFPAFISHLISFNKNDCVLQPWKKFGYECVPNKKGAIRYRLISGCETPSWWKDYNQIKHKRTSLTEDGDISFTLANLNNMVLCYSALFSLEISFIEHLSNQPGNIDYNIFESSLFSFAAPGQVENNWR